MNNTDRQAIYLRDRSRLTAAKLNRAARRSGRRQVLRAERVRRLSIRAMFTRRAA